MKIIITFLLLLSPLFTTLHADYCDTEIDLSGYDTGDYLNDDALSINSNNGSLRLGKSETYTAASGLYYDGDVYLRPGSTFTGDIYATGAIVVRNGATLDGNAYAEGDFRLNDSGTISNDDDSKTIGVISGDFCEYGDSLTELPVAQLIGQCNAIFKDAAQGFDASSTLTMNNNSIISDSSNTNNPDSTSTDVLFNYVNKGNIHSGSCETGDCGVTGNNSAGLQNFSMLPVSGNNINAYSWLDPSDITLGWSSDDNEADEYAGTVFEDLNINGASITFLEQADPLTDHYQINSINLAEGTATLNLNPGVYAVNKFSAPGGGIINIVGDGDVYLFINSPPSGMELTVVGDPDNMNLIFNSPIQFYSETSISGSVYVNGQLTMDGSANISGRVAVENLTMNSSTKITNASVCGSDTNNYSLEIISASNALTCEPHTLQVNVIDENGDIATGYTEQITLSSDSVITTWSIGDADGTLTDNGDGSASYQFVASDQGSAIFALSNEVADDLIVTVSDGTESALSDTITFDSALIKTELSCTATINGSCTNTANLPFELTLTALKEGDTSTVCESYDPTAIKFWSEYDTPTETAELSVEVALPVTSPAIADFQTISQTETTPTELALTFVDGIATVSVNYPDAGLVNLHVQDSDNDSIIGAVAMTLNPLMLSIVDVTGNQRNNSTVVASTVSNPETTTDGEGFIRASVPDYTDLTVDTFDVTVQALKYCDDESTSAHCEGDYGEKTPSFTGDITLNGSLYFPASAAQGTIHSENGLTQTMALDEEGEMIFSDLAFDEVGTLGLSLESNNYLGISGNDITSEKDSDDEYVVTEVGRFYPGYLALTTGSFNASPVCGDAFSYMGEPNSVTFSYQLTAYAQVSDENDASVTSNYDDELDYPVVAAEEVSQFGYDQADNELAFFDEGIESTRLFSDDIYSETLWNDGQYNADLLSTTAFTLGFKRLVDAADVMTPDGPYNNGSEVNYRLKIVNGDQEKLQVSSSEACSDDICKLGNLSDLRYGRLQAGNGHGSEYQSIRVLIEETYFNGSEFIAVDSDSCTPLIADQISISTTVYTPSYSILNNPLISGKGYLQFSAPNEIGTLSYYIRLESEGTSLYTPWLLDSGNAVTCSSDAGGLDECISGQVQFGLYRGSDRVISREQTFN